ncbi:MAG: class I SAM-dependent methyltransferase [Thermoguttaceae bacterium]
MATIPPTHDNQEPVRSTDDPTTRFWQSVDTDAKFRRYFAAITGEPDVCSAATGARDHFLQQLVKQIGTPDRHIAVLDLGCGRGRLMAALLANSSVPHHNIHYIGFDRDERVLEQAKDFAESRNAQSLLASVDFIPRLEFIDWVLDQHYKLLLPEVLWRRRGAHYLFLVHYVFVVNVLHEIRFWDVPWILEQVSFRLPRGGQIWIQEMPCLPEAERRFLPWNKESLETLFDVGPGLLDSPPAFNRIVKDKISRHGIPVVHARIEKLMDDYDYIDSAHFEGALNTAVAVMKAEAHRRLGQKALTVTEALYWNMFLATAADYAEYNDSIHQVERIWWNEKSSSARCPECRRQGLTVRYQGDGLEEIRYVTCSACGYEGALVRARDEGRDISEASALNQAFLTGRLK